MEGVGAAVFLGGVILMAVLVRVWAGAMDRSRIESYIQSQGGRVVSISWAPFGKGWFGEKSDRIYEVVYYDRDGHQHLATCKTSMFTGVYFTDDRIAHRKARWEDSVPSEPSEPLIHWIDEPEVSEFDEVAELREENRRLKEELARLKENR